MLRTLHRFRPLLAAATATAVFMLSAVGAAQAQAQASLFSAEITKIEIPEKRVTFKASMGQHTMRVADGVALKPFKPGDKVLLGFGQEGAESVITRIEPAKP